MILGSIAVFFVKDVSAETEINRTFKVDIKALIFDLDGVVVDTAKYHYLAWKKLARRTWLLNFRKKHNERLKGVSRVRSLEILLEVGGIELDEKTKSRFS
jgi:beta-phosphoglucomutase